MVITFCGHSDYMSTKEDKEKILSLLEQLVGEKSAELFLGGYGKFDEFARYCGEAYKKTHPNVKLIFVTPYITESYQRTHLEYNKKLYDCIVYPELENKLPRFAILYRNKWMVEQADFVIAYVAYERGGAYQTYKHAKRKGKTVFNITDKEF